MQASRMIALVAASAVTLGTVVVAIPPAQADGRKEPLRETVMCSGGWIHYKTPRYLTGGHRTELFASKIAQSSGARQSGGMTFRLSMRLGDDELTPMTSSVSGKDGWAIFKTNHVPKGTRFFLAAKMPAAETPCDRRWAGTLYY